MTTTRRLQIIIDQAGNAAQGIQGIASKFGGIGGVAKAAAGGLAILGGAATAAGGFLVSLGSDAEEMQGKFDVVFAQTGGQVTRQLEEFGAAVGRNKFELMGYASTLGDTLKPLGMTEEAAAKFATQLTQLGTDLSSFNNMPMDEAMRRLQGTLIGSHENALAFGVVINENTLSAELAKNGWLDLTGAQMEQAKVQARINLLMQGTTDAQGDAARTSGSWANQMRALKSQLSEAATAMGSELLPIVTPLLKDFTVWIREIMPKAVEIFKSWSGEMKATVGPAMLLINDAITRIAAAFGVSTEEVSASDVALAAFKGVLDAVIIAVKLFAVGMQGAAWTVEKVSEAVKIAKGLGEQIGIIYSHSTDSIKRGLDRVVDGWNRLKRAARDAVDSIPSWLRPGSPTPFEIGLKGIAGAAKNVGAALPAAFGGVGGPGLALAGAGSAGGVVQVVVNLHYAPTVSTADELELERVLTSVVNRINRKL